MAEVGADYRDVWDHLRDLMEALGLIDTGDAIDQIGLLDKVPEAIDIANGIHSRNESSPAADLLAADIQALRAEVKKPLMAISLIHKILKGRVREDDDLNLDNMINRVEAVCLWALLGDDDYLSDEGDRVALLGPKPDASSPSAETPR